MGYVRVRGGVRATGPISLPAGYTILKYIESTGTQYIDTGFKPNQDTRVVLDFHNSGDYSGMTTGLCPLLGARNASSSAVFALWVGATSYPHYGNVAYNKNGSFTTNINARLIYDYDKNVIAIGDSQITCASATFTTNYNLCILTINNYGTIESRRASGKLYSCKIYDNGTLVRDFIPCKNADGVPGLWDLVNKQFYPSASSTAFKEPPPDGLPKIGTPLNDMTWEQVGMIVGAGLASSYFAVGDTKTIAINGTVGATTFSNLSIDAFILGINHNPDIEGANKIHFGLGKIGGVDVALCDSKYLKTTTSSGYFTMNPNQTTVGGWASSHMRKTVLGSDSDPLSPTANTLLAALPADLRAVLKSITKYSDNSGNTSYASAVTATVDYLPLMAEFEIKGSRTYANSAEQNSQEQYAYYVAGNSAVRHKYNSTSEMVDYHTRSTVESSSSNFCAIHSYDYVYEGYAYRDLAVAPVFAVGGSAESGGDLISFTMNGVTYQAEKDMTWVDYVNSSYNILSLTVASEGQIKHPSGGYIWRNVGSTLTLVNYNGVETTIVDGMDYYWDE